MFKNILIIHIFSLTLSYINYKIQYSLLKDSIFDKYIDFKVYANNCKTNFYYRGRPQDIYEIINNNKFNSYKSVFIDDNFDFKNNIHMLQKFPKSTIFFTTNDITGKLERNDYCFIELTYNYFYSYSYSYYYIQIGEEINETLSNYIFQFLYVFAFTIFCFLFIYIFKIRKTRGILLYVNRHAYKIISIPLLVTIFCTWIKYSLLVSLIHTIYKSALIVYLIYLLSGHHILYFENIRRDKLKYSLILILVELFFSIIFIYIIYLIPSLDNFYLFFAKSLIEHFVLLVILVKMFLNKFIRLFKQYRFERRIRAILTLAYKYKLLIYSKVFIFSFLYSLGFIILNIIILSYHINYYIYGLHYIYYMNLILELLFSIIYIVVFFPTKYSLLYYIQVHNYNYNSINFIGTIKKNKEEDMKINKINKNILKEEYLKQKYPLVLIEPFAQTERVFNDPPFIHVGIANQN